MKKIFASCKTENSIVSLQMWFIRNIEQKAIEKTIIIIRG